MEIYLVNGADTNFADVILKNKLYGKTCSVASYGFGVIQVKRLISSFDQVLLVADESHSQLNTSAYNAVVEMDKNINHFKFRPTKIHAKFALVDNEIFIFTSANLSANRRIESYMIGSFNEVVGLDKIKKLMGNPCDFFKKNDINKMDFDIEIDDLLSNLDLDVKI